MSGPGEVSLNKKAPPSDKYDAHQIMLDNREIAPPPRDEQAEKKRMMIWSGILSIVMFAIIMITLPFTVLSFGGLVVYASTVALILFLFNLLFRYFAILLLAYFYITKYTVLEREGYFPFISIVMPVFNEGPILKENLKSLLNLDYPNYEILVINDGSKDETLDVALEMVGYHKGISSMVKISILNKPNGGKSKALNAGCQYSEADIVLNVDG